MAVSRELARSRPVHRGEAATILRVLGSSDHFNAILFNHTAIAFEPNRTQPPGAFHLSCNACLRLQFKLRGQKVER